MRLIMLPVLVCLSIQPCLAAGEGGAPAPQKCAPVDKERFWLPDDQARAMDDFLDKARRINDTGTCVVDGWFGKNAHKFYMTIVPPGSSKIGRVVSFSYEELKK